MVRNLKKQLGMSMYAVIFIFIVCGCGSILGMKVIPIYLEHSSLKKVLVAIAASEEGKSGTVRDIRVAFQKRADVAYVTVVQPEDIEISKEGGVTVLGVKYDKKIPLFANWTLVLAFDYSTSEGE